MAIALPSGPKRFCSSLIRAQVRPAGQAVGQHDRQRQHFRRLVGGIADHHALVARADGVGIGPGIQRVVDGGFDVRALGMDQRVDLVILRVVADTAQYLAGDLGFVGPGARRDLAHQEDVPFGGRDLAGHAGIAVKCQATVQHCVGNLVAELIRVAVGHGFGGVKMGQIDVIHRLLLYNKCGGRSLPAAPLVFWILSGRARPGVFGGRTSYRHRLALPG